MGVVNILERYMEHYGTSTSNPPGCLKKNLKPARLLEGTSTFWWFTTSLSNLLATMNNYLDYENFEDFNMFDDMMNDLFSDVNDFAAMENFELKTALAEQEIKLAEQALEIQRLKRAIGALETAVLWCGESCFDELAADPESNFQKIE